MENPRDDDTPSGGWVSFNCYEVTSLTFVLPFCGFKEINDRACISEAINFAGHKPK